MSYSFAIVAASKDEAGQKVADELVKVVASQPVHDRDRQAAQDVAEAFINMLKDPAEGEGINVSMYGSLGWHGEGVYTNANVSVTVTITRAPA